MTAGASAVPGEKRHDAASRFTEGAITPTLLRFALPLLATNFLHSVAAIWGAVWASHALGPNALTAVVTATVLMWMMMGAAMGIGTAASVAIGQSLGAGDLPAVKRVVGSALALVAVLALLVAAAGWALSPSIVGWIGTPEPARALTITHLRFTFLAMPSIFCYLVMMMVMRGAGDSKTPFKFTLVWIAGSLLLTPWLVTGGAGLPPLGIAGLGLASGLANAVALATLVTYVYRQRLPIALRRGDLHHLWPDPALLSLMLRRGLPLAMETVVVQGAYFVLIGMVNSYGAATAAAYSGAAQLWVFVQMPSNALAASMSAMAAINIGAGHWQRVEQIAKRGCSMSLVIACVATVLIYALGDLPLRLFLPEGGEMLAQAWQINLIVLWGWIALSASMGLFGVVRANGAMLAPMLIFGVSMWAARVPFAKALQPLLGADAIWWSFPFGSICAASMALAYYRWGSWRNRPLMLSAQQPTPEEAQAGE